MRLTLKRQFLILIFIQILFAVFIQSYYSFNLNRLLVNRQKEFIKSSENQIITIIKNKHEVISYIGDTLVLNTFHQEYINETDPLKKAQLIYHIKRNFSETCDRNQDLVDIKILSTTGDILIENSQETRFIMNDMLIDYPLKNIKMSIKTKFYHDKYFSLTKKNKNYFFYISPIYSTTKYTGKPLGYIVITLSLNHVNSYLEKDTEFIITDKTGYIGASTNLELLGMNILDTSFETNINKRPIENIDWIIYTYRSFTDIKTDITPVINNGIIILLTALLFITL